MKQFQLRYLDKLDFVVLVRKQTAADDLDALAEAERRSVTHTIEVWDGDRKVARVKKGNLPLTAEDILRSR